MDQSPVLLPMSSSNSARRLTLRKSSTPQTPQTPQSPAEEQLHEIPSVKPVVDNHDRLWAEMDVLEDAAEMAAQAQENKSFFGSSHAAALEQLQQAQARLVEAMADSEQRHDREKYRSLWENNDIESMRRNLFDEQQFDSMSEHVKETKELLHNVAKYMSAVDEQSREFWQSSSSQD